MTLWDKVLETRMNFKCQKHKPILENKQSRTWLYQNYFYSWKISHKVNRWQYWRHLQWYMGLRNLYAGQEATVRTGHGTTDWFQIRKGVCQGCILSSCLFNLYAEYIMRNAVLDEAQSGIKISGKNINNLRYQDDTTLLAES